MSCIYILPKALLTLIFSRPACAPLGI
jgi:hypothetical protein